MEITKTNNDESDCIKIRIGQQRRIIINDLILCMAGNKSIFISQEKSINKRTFSQAFAVNDNNIFSKRRKTI
jgi:hypothetical protein